MERLAIRLLLPLVEACFFVLGGIHRAACFAARCFPGVLGRPLLWIYLRITAGFRKHQTKVPASAVKADEGSYAPSVVKLAERFGTSPATIVETLSLSREDKLEVLRAGLDDSCFASTEAVARVRCLAAMEPALLRETLGAAAVEERPPAGDSRALKRAEHALRYLEAGVHVELFEPIVTLLSCRSEVLRTLAASHLVAFASDAVVPFLQEFSGIADSYELLRHAEAAIGTGRATPAFREALWSFLTDKLAAGGVRSSSEISLLLTLRPAEAFQLLTRDPHLDLNKLGPVVIRETVKRGMTLPVEILEILTARATGLKIEITLTLLNACVLARCQGTGERIRALLDGPVRDEQDRTRVEAAYGLLLAWHGAPDLRKMVSHWESQHGDSIESMPELLADTALLMVYGYFKDYFVDGVCQNLAMDASGRMQAALRRCGLTREAATFATAMRALRGLLPLSKGQDYWILPEPECATEITTSILHKWRSRPPIYHEVARFAWEHREEAKRIAVSKSAL